MGVELGAAGLLLGELVAEVADAGSGGGVVHGSGFEGGVVAVDGGFGGDAGGEFGVAVVGGVGVLGVGVFDHGDEGQVGVGVEVVEGL
ncbi:hypothetical protein Drose_30965 [Dactylosporangium roseum]|uniref:Uncharacterized protein n=1 Tax=Dactylosporangium roseum TaxID=47989 RepID=A0ABY5Z360_9ACTN|nr:hypothetical protein [Dactylosporangium roseum]UWZ35505.1 hypothetical protein Drose_30965 [Dactylosporangium roseum]